ncbi:MAG: hypothetical protein WCB10_17805 [Steroidobacteraceae bacterium]
MNAVPRPKAAQAIPRTIESLRDEIATLERSASDMRRAESAARTSLPALIAQGDAAGIADARETIKLAEAKLKRAVSDLEHTREALRVAQARDRAQESARAYRNCEKLVSDTRRDVEAMGDALIAFALALKAAMAGLNSADSAMMHAGVTPDHWSLRAKLIGIVQIALHLESGGLVGQVRTLDSADELRENGRADLKLAAREYHTLTLQRLRSKLHITAE